MVWSIDLSGKCIVVSGGNRGIGRAISEQCAQAGAHVAMIYRSSEDAPDQAEQIAEKYGVKCVAFQCDVTDQTAVQKLMKEIYHDVGPVGGVVCNAGQVVAKPALEMTKEDFNSQMDPNVWGVFCVSQAAALLWKEHGYKDGRIIFVSSVSASIANKGAQQCFYNTSKGALTMLAKTLAMEWADMGILINNLSPGYVATDMTKGMTEDDDKLREIEGQTLLNRVSQPDEQAGIVVFFLSDKATYVTGTELKVDGGLSAW